MFVALAATTALMGSPLALAQLEPGGTVWPATPSSADSGRVEGRIAAVESAGPATGPMVTMLKLEDGTLLTVPGQAGAARVGNLVSARYEDVGGDKVITHLRVEPEVQAP